MRTREAGMVGGLIAALGAGSFRCIDDCARVGMRSGSHLADDSLVRVGSRTGASLGDDATIRAGSGLGDDALRTGAGLGDDSLARHVAIAPDDALGRAAGEAGVAEGEATLGRRVVEHGVQEVVETTAEAFVSGDFGDDDLARYRAGAPSRAVPREPKFFEIRDELEVLGQALDRRARSNPIAVLVDRDDHDRTLARPSRVDAVLGACASRGRDCIVLVCEPADRICRTQARAAWSIAVDEGETSTRGLLQALYVALAVFDHPPLVFRLAPTASGELERITVEIR